jgi:hypothetical protein
MGRKSFGNRIRGWFPKEPNIPSNKQAINYQTQGKPQFEFNKRFWMSLALSYVAFLFLVVIPFLLGYISSTILGYGLAGIVDSLVLMVIVYQLNRVDPLFRKRLGYVVLGAWLGLAVGCVFGIVLFGHQIIAAAGDMGFVAAIFMPPVAGSFIGYLAGKRILAPYPIQRG